ncbi:hypothetical protein [Mycolicibacterium hippocampi]|uniref:hypothetical protein n=1 Tax=Mycolicibacterium hippocampi TaxID=659824 RepID=UPI003530C5B4
MMRRPVIVAALAAAGVAAAACTAPEDPPNGPDTAPTSTSTSVTPSVGHGSLAYCLSQHGMPAPPGPTADAPPGVDPAAWEQAMAECSSLAPGPAG